MDNGATLSKSEPRSASCLWFLKRRARLADEPRTEARFLGRDENLSVGGKFNWPRKPHWRLPRPGSIISTLSSPINLIGWKGSTGRSMRCDCCFGQDPDTQAAIQDPWANQRGRHFACDNAKCRSLQCPTSTSRRSHHVIAVWECSAVIRDAGRQGQLLFRGLFGFSTSRV